MKKNLITLALAAAIVTPLSVSAFSLTGALGAATGTTASADSPAAPAADPSAAQDQLVRAYVAADQNVLASQVQMATALGLKDDAAKAQATSDALSSGATKDGLSDSNTTQSEVSKSISAKLADKDAPALSDAAKRQFSSGMASLARGALGYAMLKNNVTTFSNSVSAMSPVQMGTASTKLGAGMYIVKNAPDHAKNVYDALGNAVSFAKSHNIPVPADVTSATSAI